jgi:hypothetical protein
MHDTRRIRLEVAPMCWDMAAIFAPGAEHEPYLRRQRGHPREIVQPLADEGAG